MFFSFILHFLNLKILLRPKESMIAYAWTPNSLGIGKSRQVKSGLATGNLGTEAWLGKSRQVKSGLAPENLGHETYLNKFSRKYPAFRS